MPHASIASLSFVQRWRYALKPASWPKILVPATLGQALGVAHLGRVDIAPGIFGFAWTWSLLAAVVLLNDYGDRDVDTLKRQMFPHGCSAKTIPDKILPARSVLMGGIAAAAVSVALAYYGESWLNRPGLGLAAIASLVIFVTYSFPPLRLNYRGGGELLEMLGCGFALPWMNAYMQGGLGKLDSDLWFPKAGAVLFGVAALALASAVASGLSDEASDRKGGKRTLTTMLGNAWARRITESLLVVAVIAWLGAAMLSDHVPALVVLGASGVVLFYHRAMLKLSTSAVTNAFEAQAHYKNALHMAVWRGTRTLALLLVVHRIFLS